MSISPRRLLIISPTFHDYHVAFSRAFESLGYIVDVCKYDEFATWHAKINNKINFELPAQFGKDTRHMRIARSTDRALDSLRAIQPDAVLIIRGDILGEQVFHELEARRTPYAIWFYDERERMSPYAINLARVPAVATYSRSDAKVLAEEGVNAHYVPLGFDSLARFRPRGNRHEVSFIGARYPNRQLLLEELRELGVPIRAFGRDWSHDLRDRVRTWGGKRPDIPASRDLDRTRAYGVMAGSLATINVHYRQDGFTMRTFEAAGVGAVQLIDRADVSELFSPGEEVLVFSDPYDAAEKMDWIRADARRSHSIRVAARKRTLSEHTLVHRAQALDDIFGVM